MRHAEAVDLAREALEPGDDQRGPRWQSHHYAISRVMARALSRVEALDIVDELIASKDLCLG